MVYGHHATLTLQHEIHRRIGRLLVHETSDLRERLLLVLRVGRVSGLDEDDAIPAARGLDDVPPSRRARLLLRLETRASCRIVEPRLERVDAAVERPARDRRLETGSARRVDVEIRGD